MYKLILVTLVSILLQQGTGTISPDGKFKLTIAVKEDSDLQTRYIGTLKDNVSMATIDVFNCTRRDLSAPNFYWGKDSRYLVFEQCTESFKDSRIKILNLKTKQIDFELTGLIGNKDSSQQQFDSNNDILIYFDTSGTGSDTIPDLYAFDLKTKKKKKIQKFKANMDIEFPEIKRIEGKREIKISYHDSVAGQIITKQIEY